MTVPSDETGRLAAELFRAAINGDDVGMLAATLPLDDAADWAGLVGVMAALTSEFVHGLAAGLGRPVDDLLLVLLADVEQ